LTQTDQIWHGNTGEEKHISRGSATDPSLGVGPQHPPIFLDSTPTQVDSASYPQWDEKMSSSLPGVSYGVKAGMAHSDYGRTRGVQVKL